MWMVDGRLRSSVNAAGKVQCRADSRPHRGAEIYNIVIARSEATKQSILRGKMDCFAALAMTWKGQCFYVPQNVCSTR